MLGPTNRLMAGYAQANPAPPPQRDDWTARMDALRPPSGNMDQDMIAYPPNYPDYWMPSPPIENLNSMEGVEVLGTLPVSAPQSVPNPNDPRYIEWLRLMRQRGAI